MRILQLHSADARGIVPAGGDMICPLQDADQAVVRRVINGEYSMTVNMPRGARNAEKVQIGTAIKGTVNEMGDQEYFIVKSRTRSISGGISIYAEHQSYLLNGVILASGPAYTNGHVNVVFQNMHDWAYPSIASFSTWTYSRASSLRANFPARQTPTSMMAALKNHLIGSAGGELIFRGFDVEYVDQMGADRGAWYRYGVNLTALEVEDILDGYASGIFPFWGREGDANRPMTILNQPVLPYVGTFPLQVVIPVDLTEQIPTQPSQAELLAAAEEYAAQNTPSGIPLSIKAERVNIGGNGAVDLGDTVTVTCTPWGIDTKTRISALTMDALRGRVISAEFGTINPGFAGAVKNIK